MKNYYSKHYHQWLKPECQNNKNSFCLPLKLAVFNSPQIVFPTPAGVGKDSYLCSTYLWVHVGSKMTDRVINRKVSDRKPKKRTGKKKNRSVQEVCPTRRKDKTNKKSILKWIKLWLKQSNQEDLKVTTGFEKTREAQNKRKQILQLSARTSSVETDARKV